MEHDADNHGDICVQNGESAICQLQRGGDPRSASIHPRESASETAPKFVSCTIMKVQKFPIISTQRCGSESALKFAAQDIVVDCVALARNVLHSYDAPYSRDVPPPNAFLSNDALSQMYQEMHPAKVLLFSQMYQEMHPSKCHMSREVSWSESL